MAGEIPLDSYIVNKTAHEYVEKLIAELEDRARNHADLADRFRHRAREYRAILDHRPLSEAEEIAAEPTA